VILLIIYGQDSTNWLHAIRSNQPGKRLLLLSP
jgi:hypothetical protein